MQPEAGRSDSTDSMTLPAASSASSRVEGIWCPNHTTRSAFQRTESLRSFRKREEQTECGFPQASLWGSRATGFVLFMAN